MTDAVVEEILTRFKQEDTEAAVQFALQHQKVWNV